ncbi:hypothetical protein H4R20_005437 [Coemansia guatemalensis]|uniref:LITAF domain-containing protein n=1 Tax=Coemansia guatemalensis TaxID=2761395 RepID=A0A9W8HXX0_9FUNG|nr:hypothetical protein H4R20_005437 [Coemansia guatemalensis]
MASGGIMHNQQVWPAPPAIAYAQAPGEAAAYDAQFDNDRAFQGQQQMYAEENPVQTMRSPYGAQSGPMAQPNYEHQHPGPTPVQSMAAPGQYMAPLSASGKQQSMPQLQQQQQQYMVPQSYYSMPGEQHPGEQVIIGEFSKAHIMPGSYLETNKRSANVVCPNCRQYVFTQVKTRPGARTVVAAAAIFAVYWPLAFIPFVAKPLKKKVHMCPRCGHKIGKVVTVTPV